jgi:hypothetical protein
MMDKNNLINFLILPSVGILFLLAMCCIIVKDKSSEMTIAQAFSTSNASGPEPEKALVVMMTAKNPVIIRGTNQTLEFMVTDMASGQPIRAAHRTGVSIYLNPH